jgi:signal transduction histidine kinase
MARRCSAAGSARERSRPNGSCSSSNGPAATLTERQRLAREMHDVLAHSLSGLAVHLEGARLLLAADAADPRLTGLIDRAHHLAKTGVQEARWAISMLRGDELPGPERLAALVTEFERDTGVPSRFTAAGAPRELTAGVRLALYRVTQEALTNIRKHARPGRVEVRLRYEPDAVRLDVDDLEDLYDSGDSGATAGSPPDPDGYGLTGMRERAELLGGSLRAGPTGLGFRVTLRVPL